MGSPATPPQAPTEPLPDPGIRQPSESERGKVRLLRGGHLIDVATGEVELDRDVLIENGRIVGVAPGLPPGDAEIVDVTGRYLLPGLIDLHVHPGMMLGLRGDPNGQSAERMKHDLQVWLRHGVTSVQSMGTDRPFAEDIQAEQLQGSFTGARLYSTFTGFGANGGVPPIAMDPPGPVRFEDKDSIRSVLVELSERGASGVKIWYDDWYHQLPKMPERVARTIIDGCRELKLTSYAHVYYVDDAKTLVGYGLNVLAHMPRDREVDQELIDLMRERGAAALPTLTVPESNVAYVDKPAWVSDPLFSRFLPPGTVDYVQSEGFLQSIRAKPEYPELHPDVERAKRNTWRLFEAGVRIGFGTDTGTNNRVIGFFDHRELELLVECGLSPAQALRAATLTNAEILGRADELGSISPPRRADIVVLRENPLERIINTRTIESVWQDGNQVAGPL